MGRKLKQSPTYLFWLLEVAVERGDERRAARARAALEKRGFRVTVTPAQSNTPTHAPAA
jgi:hypothetical protein